MGLSVNTSDQFKYVFEDQRDLPADQQNYLIFRYLSAREHSLMEGFFASAMNAETPDCVIDNAVSGISIGLVGWHGYAIQFGGECVDAVCSRVDLMELVRELGSAMTLSQLEKKVSVSLSLSTSAKSARETPEPESASRTVLPC